MPFFLSAIRNPVSEIQSSTSGSTLWQTVFVSFAVVLLLLEVIRGYRLGLPRQLMRGAAIICAYAAAYFAQYHTTMQSLSATPMSSQSR